MLLAHPAKHRRRIKNGKKTLMLLNLALNRFNVRKKEKKKLFIQWIDAKLRKPGKTAHKKPFNISWCNFKYGIFSVFLLLLLMHTNWRARWRSMVLNWWFVYCSVFSLVFISLKASSRFSMISAVFGQCYYYDQPLAIEHYRLYFFLQIENETFRMFFYDLMWHQQ